MGEVPKELREEQVEWKWNDTKIALLYEIFKKWNKCKKTKKSHENIRFFGFILKKKYYKFLKINKY